MAANLAKWPSNRGLISKIRPSDGCEGNTVPSRWYGGMISANLEVIWVMSGHSSWLAYEKTPALFHQYSHAFLET